MNKFKLLSAAELVEMAKNQITTMTHNTTTAHQQGRTAARQLLAEYGEPTCSSSRTMPELPMVEMLVQCIGQNRSDACDYLTGWAEIIAPILTSAIDCAEPELGQRDLDEALIHAAITTASFISMKRIAPAMLNDPEAQGVLGRLVAAVIAAEPKEGGVL